MCAGEVIVEIQPQELKFTFELKRQSSCSIQLVNKSKDYVAFKLQSEVKTTSPKRYCVRPNTGIIQPRSVCDFTVTMQAPKEAPPDMQLKDKFLIQSTVVPYGTMDEDIVPSFFSKENGRYIQENKLRVVLISPPHSPKLEAQLTDKVWKQESSYQVPDQAKTSITSNYALKVWSQEPTYQAPDPIETSIVSDVTLKPLPADEVPILRKASSMSSNEAITQELDHENSTSKESCSSSDRTVGGVADFTPAVAKDIDDLKLKLNNLEVKLDEAEKTIGSLREENNAAIQERDKFQREIDVLRTKYATKVQTGFPFLFVIFTALASTTLGYLFHS